MKGDVSLPIFGLGYFLSNLPVSKSDVDLF
jgi:hypothetical protein